MKNLSIGMFDSGIGGLTVLKEVRKILPNEHIIYLGDTARVPYGNKSPQTITKYALESAIFLLTKGIKILVVACNTSSALALGVLQKKLPVPVLGVIEPGAKEAVRHSKNKKIGIIGTKATISSMAYVNAMKRLDPDIEVFSKPCPLFVPIAEEGLENDKVAIFMAEKYLEELKACGIDTLVLGCTHYPLLEWAIKTIMGDGITIINTGIETAKEVQKTLEQKRILNDSGKKVSEYFVTDSPETFKEIGNRFLGEEIKRIKFLKSLDFKDYLLSS
jgi:glutamate racemase